MSWKRVAAINLDTVWLRVDGGFKEALVDGGFKNRFPGAAARQTEHIFCTEFASVDQLMGIFEEVTGRPRPWLRLPPPLMAGIAEVSGFVMTNFFPSVPQRFTPAAVRLLRMQRRADCTKANRNSDINQPALLKQSAKPTNASFAGV